MIQVTVLFFATLKDRAGTQMTSLELPQGATVRQLKSALEERYPALAVALPSALVSVNREFAFDDDPLPAGAEVALFPPVSGGAPP
jgi:molybdopterin converting factor subunit 1